MSNRTLAQLLTATALLDFESETDIKTEVEAWLNEGLFRCAREELRCFETLVTFATTAAKYDYDLATYLPDYRKLITITSENGPINFQDIKRVDYQLYAKAEADLTTGDTPDIAFMFDDDLYLYPIPNSVININARYYYIPDEMDDTHDCPIPRERDNLLIKFAKANYDFRENDMDKYRQRMAEFEGELNQWIIDDFEQCEDTTSMIELERQYKEDWRR